jgi:hypothetical protein
VTEHTLEAPGPHAPVAAAPHPERRRSRDLLSLVRSYPWIAGGIGLLIAALVIVLWARSRPGYDPYGWLVWGKLTLHLNLDTNGAPSWKPLPYLFTVPYALLGRYALWVWMVTSVAVSLSGIVFAWRIAFRLVGAEPRRRYAAYAAGLAAAVFVVLIQDPIAPANYLHYLFSAESDTMIVALCLAAIDCHLSGRHRWAFWMWWLASLGRPEVWPFCGLAGLWLWRVDQPFRRWLYAALGGLIVLWFGIPGISSKSFFTAGNIAQNSPRALHGNKITGTIKRFHELLPNTVWVAAALTVAWAAYRRHRAILILTAGALAWLVIEIALALKGFPAVPRYLFEPGAVVAILGAVFIGRLILELPPLLTGALRRLSPERIGMPLATGIGAWGTGIAVVAIAGSLFGAAHRQYGLERQDLKHERARTVLIGRLSGLVSRLGPSRILACGQPNLPIEYQSIFAWYMNIKIGELYVSQTYLRKHPHPLVNIYPIAGPGWKVFPSHVTAASASRCHGLRLVYRP